MKKMKQFRQTAISNHLFLQIVNISGQVVLVPVFLRNYSQDLYVFWIVMGALSSFMLLADSAILQTFSVRLTKYYIENNSISQSLIRQVIRTLVVLELVSFVFLISAFGVVRVRHDASQTSFIVAISILCSLLLANMITVAIHFYLLLFQVSGEYKMGINFISKGKIVEVCFLIVLASFGLELLKLALAIVAIRLITAYLMARRLKIPKDEIELPVSRDSLLTRNLAGAIAMSATVILASQGMLVVLSQWASAKEILLFTVSKMLAVPVRIAADSFALGTFPLLVKKFHLQENLISSSKKLVQLYLSLVIALVPIIVILGSRFFGHLTNNEIAFNFNFLILTIASVALDGLVTILFQQVLISSKSFQPGISYLLLTILQLVIVGIFLTLHNIVHVVLLNIVGDLIMLLLIRKAKVEK